MKLGFSCSSSSIFLGIIGSNIPPVRCTPPITQIGECKGSADCFTGIVTEIVDGDTIDVNNVRVRLSMVDTPERGEVGYNEATKITVSVCPVGANALIDEDDGQKEGSHDRLIGVVYCNGSTTSLNQILLEESPSSIMRSMTRVGFPSKSSFSISALNASLPLRHFSSYL